MGNVGDPDDGHVAIGLYKGVSSVRDEIDWMFLLVWDQCISPVPAPHRIASAAVSTPNRNGKWDFQQRQSRELATSGVLKRGLAVRFINDTPVHLRGE